MLVRHASIYAAGEVLNRVCKVISLYLLADIQSRLEFGLYNYIVAAVGVVLILLDCGLNMLVILRANGDRLQRLFKVFFAAKLVLIVLVSAVAAMLVVAPVGETDFPLLGSVAAVVTLSIGWDLSVFLASAHRANFDYAGEAIAKFLWNAVFVSALIAAKVVGADVSASQAVLLQVLAFAVAIAWSLSRIGWRGVAILRVDRRTMRQVAVLLSIGVPFTATAAAASLLNSIDLLLLGLFSKFELLASFSVAHKFCLLTYVPLAIVQGFTLPYLAAYFGNTRRAALSDRLDSALAISLAFGVSLSQFYILAIEWVIIPALGTEKYPEVVWMSRVMALYVPLMYSHTVLWTLLVSMRYTVAANMPAAITVPVLACVDYLVISAGYTELLNWSPVLANALMLGGLTIVCRLKLGTQPLSAKTSMRGAVCIGLLLALSYASPADGPDFAALRLFVALTATAIGVRLMMRFQRPIRQ